MALCGRGVLRPAGIRRKVGGATRRPYRGARWTAGESRPGEERARQERARPLGAVLRVAPRNAEPAGPSRPAARTRGRWLCLDAAYCSAPGAVATALRTLWPRVRAVACSAGKRPLLSAVVSCRGWLCSCRRGRAPPPADARRTRDFRRTVTGRDLGVARTAYERRAKSVRSSALVRIL